MSVHLIGVYPISEHLLDYVHLMHVHLMGVDVHKLDFVNFDFPYLRKVFGKTSLPPP
jgi:hypothetical protein